MDILDGEYTDWISSQRSESTKTTYRAAITGFAKWAASGTPEEALGLLLNSDVRDAEVTLQAWADHLCATGSPKTAHSRVSCMMVFLRRAFARRVIPQVPKRPKVSEPNVRATPQREADPACMIASLDQSDERDLRDAVLIDLLSLLPSAADVAALDIEHVTEVDGKVTVASSASIVEVTGDTASRLLEWRHHRGMSTGPLFVGVLSSNGNQKIKRLGARAIRKRIDAISMDSGGSHLSPRDLAFRAKAEMSAAMPADAAKLVACLSDTNPVGA